MGDDEANSGSESSENLAKPSRQMGAPAKLLRSEAAVGHDMASHKNPKTDWQWAANKERQEHEARHHEQITERHEDQRAAQWAAKHVANNEDDSANGTSNISSAKGSSSVSANATSTDEDDEDHSVNGTSNKSLANVSSSDEADLANESSANGSSNRPRQMGGLHKEGLHERLSSLPEGHVVTYHDEASNEHADKHHAFTDDQYVDRRAAAQGGTAGEKPKKAEKLKKPERPRDKLDKSDKPDA